MLAPRNILAATDFSPASETALQYARELARAFGSTLHVVHVISEPVPEAISPAYVPETGNTWQALQDAAREQLHEIATARDMTNVALTEHLMTSSSPAMAILECAKSNNIDLIVLGTHGRSGVAHFLLGSVAEKVVRSAPCPVLTVRQPERESLKSLPRESAARA
jgi:nucleotide-binding universal stress UspA family protein